MIQNKRKNQTNTSKLKFASFILFFLVYFCPLKAQEEMKHAPLCQGHFYTEAEGKAVLATQGQSYLKKSNWKKRKKQIRKGILIGAELPKRLPSTPLNPIRHSRKTFSGYTVENVAFESLPGLFVSGNLYMPIGYAGQRPAILSSHGHWQEEGDYGRYRTDVQMRSASLARMGAVVFSYDMLGYGDSDQSKHKHPKALKLQTISSQRAIDFLQSLPEVDDQRIAITGASGGGTQAFILTAVDKRIKVSVPVVQVSAHFFGGCACESGMPIHTSAGIQTSNVEIAALAAPRPMLLVSDGEDWTKNTPEVEFPHLQHIYSLYKKQALVENVHLANEGHSYGSSKRMAAYPFLAKHLGLSLAAITDATGVIKEENIELLSRKALRVFDAEHPRPSHAVIGDEAISSLADRFK